MPGSLFGVAPDPAEEAVSLVGLLLLGITFIVYGILGYRKRQVYFKGIELDGGLAQIWGVLLVMMGLASAGYSLTALLRRGG